MASSGDEDYEYEYSDEDDYSIEDDDDEDIDMEVENPNAAPMAWTKTPFGGKYPSIQSLLFICVFGIVRILRGSTVLYVQCPPPKD